MKYILLLLALIVLSAAVNTYALQCSEDWQCQSVTENYNYVQCLDGLCECKWNNGFIGLATSDSKCHCPEPRDVHWNSGSPYCLSFQEAVDDQLDKMREQVLADKIVEIYQSTIWPTPTLIIAGLIQGDNSLMENIFSPTASGRVDPVGSYNDFEGIVEYFYGTIWTPSAQVHSIDIRKLAVQGNKASVRVNLFLNYYDQFGVLTGSGNITQTGIYTFNDNDLVEKTELIIHNLGKASNPTTPPGLQTIGTACYLIMQQAGCGQNEDPDGYYSDFNDCIAYMSGIEHGDWDRVPSNTVLCRYYHALLAIARPTVHCSHSGKTGGGKCIDTPYSDYYLKEY